MAEFIVESPVETENDRSLYSVLNRCVWDVIETPTENTVVIYRPQFNGRYTPENVRSILNSTFRPIISGQNYFYLQFHLFYDWPATSAPRQFAAKTDTEEGSRIINILNAINDFYKKVYNYSETLGPSKKIREVIEGIMDSKSLNDNREFISNREFTIYELLFHKTLFTGITRLADIKQQETPTESFYIINLSPRFVEPVRGISIPFPYRERGGQGRGGGQAEGRGYQGRFQGGYQGGNRSRGRGRGINRGGFRGQRGNYQQRGGVVGQEEEQENQDEG